MVMSPGPDQVAMPNSSEWDTVFKVQNATFKCKQQVKSL